MSVEQQVRDAGTPGEALLILARAIDALEDLPAADPWQIPDDKPTANFGAIAPPKDTSAIEAQIAQLEILRAETGDPEDSHAITARIGLLRDELRPETSIDVEEDEVRSRVEGENIVLPEPSPELRAERLEWAEKELFKHAWPEGLEFDEACEAYATGGPLWLYYGNREFVRTLPLAWQQRMVADVAGISPIESQEMGRDLLKMTGTEGPESQLERKEFVEEYKGPPA